MGRLKFQNFFCLPPQGAAPDLEWVGKNGWRFVNAVSDFATHADPIRKTRNYNENLFLRTAEGNPMIDKAYKMVLAAA